MSRRLIVLYDGPVEKELEAKLKECITSTGWEFYDGGFDPLLSERDLLFFKCDDEEEPINT